MLTPRNEVDQRAAKMQIRRGEAQDPHLGVGEDEGIRDISENYA